MPTEGEGRLVRMVKKRMTGKQRREQLIEIGRELFAERGFEGTSMEEIAGRARVSKPVVYEHFGGKEGLYAVVVDREMRALEEVVTSALKSGRSRQRIEKTVLALLTYVEKDTAGFQILARDGSGPDMSTPKYSTLLNSAIAELAHILAANFERNNLNPGDAVMYSQALVGMVSSTALWWLDNPEIPKREVAAHIVNLCWNGMSGLEQNPTLSVEAEDMTQELEQALEHESDKEGF
ncbi:TetR family transcriptional regulator [Corynebacterium renale]|uniref:TetR family transcriptional regulator n=2 Tax=Corynebacterium renale TaxID=1724 RepID=A0A2A9DRR0_9CORY|nr:TetR family transcriptional regulator [Corynebacterium renale]SQI25276.1 TetR family transcriptional regulator [Corynebacterium renale]